MRSAPAGNIYLGFYGQLDNCSFWLLFENYTMGKENKFNNKSKNTPSLPRDRVKEKKNLVLFILSF